MSRFHLIVATFGVLALCLSACKKEPAASEDSTAESAAKTPAEPAVPSDEKPTDEKPTDEKPTDEKPTEPADDDHKPEGDDHGKMPAEVAAFHDVFAPIWHIEDKKARNAKFCEVSENVLKAADALQEMKAPEGADAKAWEKAIYDIGAYVGDTDRACSSDKANFEKYITGVHDALHKVMEISAGKH